MEPAGAVAGRGYVHSPADFAEAPESQGDDVYLCEYEYDEAWKRFRKRRWDQDGADDLAGLGSNCPVTPAGEGVLLLASKVIPVGCRGDVCADITGIVLCSTCSGSWLAMRQFAERGVALQVCISMHVVFGLMLGVCLVVSAVLLCEQGCG